MQKNEKTVLKTSKDGYKAEKATTSGAKTNQNETGTIQNKEAAKPKQMEAVKLPSPANASDRLGKLEQFQKLGERFEFLKNKDRELKNFTASQDGTLGKITLACVGSNVEISNSMIIDKVVKVCQSELDVLLAKTEAEVINFNI